MNDTPQNSQFGETLPPDPLETLRPDPTKIPGARGDRAQSELTLSNWAVSVRHEGTAPVEGESELDLGGDAPEGRPEYELRRVIGRGGFGEVYEAVQLSLKRIVALKRLRVDRLGSQTEAPASWTANVRMFREEAFISAQLDHPNILPVHDLGRDDSGLPVMAMKLVRGKPWDDLIRTDFDAMPVEEFLARHIPILIDVAHAVAFAHSRGIIHRDLKPAQVMVGAFGEVLLMDWGLALNFDSERLKELSSGDVISELPTTASASNPAGTPAYMAPEQTEMTSGNVGPWTDIYLLGGMLYVLLTGRAPRIGASSLNAMRQAQDGEYTPVGEGAPMGRHLPEGLAALCTKALNPSRFERVPSAEEFVAGLQDHLSGALQRSESMAIARAMAGRLERAKGDYHELNECITGLTRSLALWPRNPEAAALRESAFEDYARGAITHGDLALAQMQAGQLDDARRRDGLLGEISRAQEAIQHREKTRRFAFVAVGALLVVIAVGSTVFAVRLRDRTEAAEAAKAAAEVSEAQAVTARKSAEDSSASANRARTDAEGLISFMLGDLRDKLEPVGRIEILDSASGKVIEYFESLPAGSRTADSLLRQAQAYSQNSTVSFRKGEMDQAKDFAAKALATGLRLEKEYPNTKEVGLALVDANYYVGMAALGRGDISSALVSFQEAYNRSTPLLASGSRDSAIVLARAQALDGLSTVSQATRDYLASTKWKMEEIELREEYAKSNPDSRLASQELSGAILGMVVALDGLGRTEEALDFARRALVIDEKNYNAPPESTDLQERFAFSLFFIARLEARRGNPKAAVEPGRRALKLRRERYAHDPKDTVRCLELVLTLGMVSGFEEALGNKDEAMALGIERGELLKGLITLDPDNDQFQRQYYEWHVMTGDAMSLRKRSDEALQYFSDAAEIARSQFKKTNAAYWRDTQATGLVRKARLLGSLNRCEEAAALGLQVIADAEAISEANPTDKGAIDGRGFAYNQVGTVLLGCGRTAEALALATKYIAICDQLVASEPQNGTYRRNQAFAYVAVSEALMIQGDARTASENLEKGVASMRTLLDAEPNSIRYKTDTATFVARLGAAHMTLKDLESAKRSFGVAHDLWAEVLAANPVNDEARSAVASTLLNLAKIDFEEGNLQLADAGTSEAIGLLKPEGRDLTRLVPGRLAFAGAALLEGRCHEAKGDSEAAKAAWEAGLVYLNVSASGTDRASIAGLSISLLLRLNRTAEVAPKLALLREVGALGSAVPEVAEAVELARSKGLLTE